MYSFPDDFLKETNELCGIYRLVESSTGRSSYVEDEEGGEADVDEFGEQGIMSWMEWNTNKQDMKSVTSEHFPKTEKWSLPKNEACFLEG